MMRRTLGAGIALLVTTAAAAWWLSGTNDVAMPLGGTVAAVTGGLLKAPSASPAPTATTATQPVTAGSPVTLGDLVYYGTCWWQLQSVANTTPLPALGAGYRDPQVTYDANGDYFAGTVEKVDASGRITDVILAFAAAKSGNSPNPLADVTDNSLVTYGMSSAQTNEVERIYRATWTNPRWSGAKIHVTGLSLGSAWTQYAVAFSVATYGRAATASRATFTHFGTPGYAQGIATHFGLTLADFDGLITGYNAKNDPTPATLPPGGFLHGQPTINSELMGTVHWLADYQPYGPLPLYGALNGVASHQSWPYFAAFGWPAWMTLADRQATVATIGVNAGATNRYDPTYGASGVAQTIIGDGAANALTGTAADDSIQGRGGADVLAGAGGRNTFVYAQAGDSTPGAPDTITDFASGDTIDLTGFGRLTGFTFIGQATPASAGQVGYRYSGDVTIVEVNTSGGVAPDLVIRLTGPRTLTAANFALGGTLSSAAAYLAYQLLNTTGDPFIDHLVGVPLT